VQQEQIELGRLEVRVRTDLDADHLGGAAARISVQER